MTETDNGRLAENVVHFVRLLRRAGLPIGPARAIDALQAVQAVGIGRRDDFSYALSAVLVNRREQQFVFDQAFQLFWRDPGESGALMQDLLQQLSGLRRVASRPPIAERVAQALVLRSDASARDAAHLPPDVRIDARLTVSAREVLQRKDFASM